MPPQYRATHILSTNLGMPVVAVVGVEDVEDVEDVEVVEVVEVVEDAVAVVDVVGAGHVVVVVAAGIKACLLTEDELKG